MKMFMMKGDEDVETGKGVARARQPAVIPPFTFPGAVDATESPIWYPPRAIIITDAAVSASWPGTSPVTLLLYRLEYGNQRSLLGSASLSAYNENPTAPSSWDADLQAKWIKAQKDAQFRNKLIKDAGYTTTPLTISPFEGLFVKSTVASGHENVVVQVIGEYL